MFTFSSLRSRNLLIPCQSLASPNSGSIHTLRFLSAFSQTSPLILYTYLYLRWRKDEPQSGSPLAIKRIRMGKTSFIILTNSAMLMTHICNACMARFELPRRTHLGKWACGIRGSRNLCAPSLVRAPASSRLSVEKVGGRLKRGGPKGQRLGRCTPTLTPYAHLSSPPWPAHLLRRSNGIRPDRVLYPAPRN